MRYNSVNLGINMEWFYCRKCSETRLNEVFGYAGWLHNYNITQDSMHNDGGARGWLDKREYYSNWHDGSLKGWKDHRRGCNPRNRCER